MGAGFRKGSCSTKAPGSRSQARLLKGAAHGAIPRENRSPMRKASIKRKTKETDVEVEVNLDGAGASQIATGIGFFDHMLDLLARHSRIDITVKAKGDLHIDHHHTTEECGIALGQAVKQALGDLKGITRYARGTMPMDA